MQSALKAREIFAKENAKIKDKKKASKQAAAALGKERNLRILGDESNMEVERRSIKMRRDDVSESDNETSVRESIIVDEKFKI